MNASKFFFRAHIYMMRSKEDGIKHASIHVDTDDESTQSRHESVTENKRRFSVQTQLSGFQNKNGYESLAKTREISHRVKGENRN